MLEFRWLRSALKLCVCLVISISISCSAFAATRGNLAAGLVPYSIAPSGFPQAFNTIGFTLGASLYVFGDSGVATHFIRSGAASVFDINYKFFLIGEPQGPYVNTEILPADREKQPMSFRKRNWGIFIEAGGGYYAATKLEFETGSKVESGICFSAAIGVEYPVVRSFSLSGRIGTYQTTTRTFQTVFGELAAGFAFDI